MLFIGFSSIDFHISLCQSRIFDPKTLPLNRKTNQGKLCIILKELYGRFRISLNNCEFNQLETWYICEFILRFLRVILRVGLKNRVRVKLVKISRFFF